MNSFAHGVRVLAKKPGFTAAAVLMLGLGIGANAAIFSLVNAFLWKPLKIHQAEELVGLYSRDARKPDSFRAFSYPNFVDLRGQRGVFTSVAAHYLALVGLTEGDSTRRLFADVVSSNYFETMGVPLFRGRVFTADEERPGSARQGARGSDSYWQRPGADAATIGRSLRLNGRWFTVVGIAAEGFTGTTALTGAELYLPLGVFDALADNSENRGRALSARDYHVLIALARPRPGGTPAAAHGGVVRARSPCPDCTGAAAPGSDPGRSRWAACRYCRGDAKSLAGGEQGSDPTGAPPFPAERFRRPHLGHGIGGALHPAAFHGGGGSADRFPQRRQYDAGSRRGPAQGDRHPPGPGRRSARYRPTTSCGEPDIGADGRHLGPLHCLVEHRWAGEFDRPHRPDRPGLQRHARRAGAGRHLRLLPAQHAIIRLHAGVESLASGLGYRSQRWRARRERRKTSLLRRQPSGDGSDLPLAHAADRGRSVRALRPARRRYGSWIPHRQLHRGGTGRRTRRLRPGSRPGNLWRAAGSPESY